MQLMSDKLCVSSSNYPHSLELGQDTASTYNKRAIKLKKKLKIFPQTTVTSINHMIQIQI